MLGERNLRGAPIGRHRDDYPKQGARRRLRLCLALPLLLYLLGAQHYDIATELTWRLLFSFAFGALMLANALIKYDAAAHVNRWRFKCGPSQVVVIVMLINLVLGIIIDTFGELRTAKAASPSHSHLPLPLLWTVVLRVITITIQAAKKYDMENTCFICGLDRFTLDIKGGGFERHIRDTP